MLLFRPLRISRLLRFSTAERSIHQIAHAFIGLHHRIVGFLDVLVSDIAPHARHLGLLTQLFECRALADHAGLECLRYAVRVLGGEICHLIITRPTDGIEFVVPVVGNASERRDEHDRQNLIVHRAKFRFLLLFDGVVVILHVALARGVHARGAASKQFCDGCFCRTRHIHHEAVVGLSNSSEGVLVRLVAVILAKHLQAVVVHHGVHSLDGVVELHLRLLVSCREQLPHPVHFHHAEVRHERQHGNVPADVVSLLELIDDVLQLRRAPVCLCELFEVRKRPPHEPNDAAVMDADTNSQRIARNGVILRHSKLRI